MSLLLLTRSSGSVMDSNDRACNLANPDWAGGCIATSDRSPVLVTNDTLPGGPRTGQRSYVASFVRAHREKEHPIAWEFLEAEHAAAGTAE